MPVQGSRQTGGKSNHNRWLASPTMWGVWGAWDTNWRYKAKDVTPSIALEGETRRKRKRTWNLQYLKRTRNVPQPHLGLICIMWAHMYHVYHVSVSCEAMMRRMINVHYYYQWDQRFQDLFSEAFTGETLSEDGIGAHMRFPDRVDARTELKWTERSQTADCVEDNLPSTPVG